jgi:hypothetical protein
MKWTKNSLDLLTVFVTWSNCIDVGVRAVMRVVEELSRKAIELCIVQSVKALLFIQALATLPLSMGLGLRAPKFPQLSSQLSL